MLMRTMRFLGECKTHWLLPKYVTVNVSAAVTIKRIVYSRNYHVASQIAAVVTVSICSHCPQYDGLRWRIYLGVDRKLEVFTKDNR